MNEISTIKMFISRSTHNVNILCLYLIYLSFTTKPVLGHAFKRDARVAMETSVANANNVAQDEWNYSFPKDLSQACHNSFGTLTDYCDIRDQICTQGMCSNNCYSICHEPYLSENGPRACDINCKTYKVFQYYDNKLREMEAKMHNMTTEDHDLPQTSDDDSLVISRVRLLAFITVFGLIIICCIMLGSILIRILCERRKYHRVFATESASVSGY